MNQILQLWNGLTLRQRISLGVAVAVVAASLLWFVSWNQKRNLKPLFANLAAEEAGKITTRLRERGVAFELTASGDTILVPSEKLAELRLELAAEGLPQSGRLGFEIFDKTNLTVTDFQEQVNYHRALEGELERSVMTLAEVEHARVHLTFAKESIFAESRQPAKASVMVKLKPGKQLTPVNVQAITHLAASAVQGLQPEAVSVLDTAGRLLNRPKKPLSPDQLEMDDAQLDYQKKVEREMLAKVQAALEPLLGAEHFRTAASVEVDFSSGDLSEEVFDPTRSVIGTQQKTEDVSGAVINAGVPGTQSALPRPTSRPGEGGRNVARRTENTTYQTSRTVRRTRLPQGMLKRISLSVLVDQDLRWEGVGDKAKRILEPPTPEKLKKISDLVSAAVGVQPQRGDQLIVESLPFEATLRVAPPPGPAPAQTTAPAPGSFAMPAWMPPLPAPLNDPKILAAAAAGVLLLLLLLIGGVVFFLKKKKNKKKAKAEAAAAELAAPGSIPALQAAAAAAGGLPAVAGSGAEDSLTKTIESALATKEERKKYLEQQALQALKLDDVGTKKGEVLAKHITEEAAKDPVSVAQLIRNWLQEDSLAR